MTQELWCTSLKREAQPCQIQNDVSKGSSSLTAFRVPQRFVGYSHYDPFRRTLGLDLIRSGYYRRPADRLQGQGRGDAAQGQQR